jgi:hypothetical protein
LYEYFSQAGADVNSKGCMAPPLVIATMRGGYTNEIRLLLKAGADPNIPDDVYFYVPSLDVLLILSSFPLCLFRFLLRLGDEDIIFDLPFYFISHMHTLSGLVNEVVLDKV